MIRVNIRVLFTPNFIAFISNVLMLLTIVLQYISFHEANYCDVYYNRPRRGETCLFGVSDKARLKPVSSAIETSQKIELSPVASLDMILLKQQTTKVLISLSGCQTGLRLCCSHNLKTCFLARRVHIVRLLYHCSSNNY